MFRSVRYHTSLSRRRQSRTVPPGRFAKRSRILKAQSGRALPTSERVERKECLRELAPESRLIAAEPVDALTVQISQAQEAHGDVTRRASRGADLRVKHLTAFCSS